MQLRELSLYGFKSFPRRTRIALGEGITAIVGPNGCGKSNIMDGLRWVLGEQNFSILRCNKNEDLIFLGAEGTPGLGYAEVKLILSNDNFQDFGSEIEIQRKFFRSGESEYLLNRSSCKLRDIEDIFSNSGGSRVYSIFSQSLIRQVLSGEISQLLEEAAGIAKYKEQRGEVTRKLEASEIDLVRLNDIVSLRERRISELSRQAKRARLYNELKEGYDRFKLIELKDRYEGIISKKEEITSKISPQRELKKGLHLKIDKKRRELEEIRKNLKELKARDRDLQNQILQLKEKRLILEADMRYLENEYSRLKKEEREKRETLSQIKSMKEEIGGECLQLDKTLGNMEEESSEKREERRIKEEELFKLREKLKEEEENLRRVFNDYNEIAREILKMDAALNNLKEYEDRGLKEKDGLKKEINRLNNELEILKEEAKTRENGLNLSRSSLEKTQRELTQKREQYEKALDKKRGLEDELSKMTNRLSLLEAKIEKGKKERLAKPLQQALWGRVFELIKPEKGMEQAIQAVICPISDLFVLKEKKLEVSFLDRKERWGFLFDKGGSSGRNKYPKGKGIRGPLSDFVEFSPHSPSLLRNLVDRFIVVEDYPTLIDYSQKYAGLSFVTLDGIAWFQEGILIVEGKEAEGVSALKEIETLKTKEPVKRDELKIAAENLEKLKREIELLQSKRVKDEEVFLNALKEHSSSEVTVSSLNTKLQDFSQRISRLSNELSRTRNTIEETAKKREAFLEKRRELENQQEEIKGKIEELERLGEAKEGEVKEMLSSEGEKLTQLARLEERKRELDRRIAEASSEEDNIRLRRLSNIEKEKEKLKENIQTAKEQFEKTSQELTLLETQEQGIEKVKDLELREESIEKELSESDKELQSLQNSIFALEMEELGLKKEQEKLEEEAEKDYKIDIRHFSSSEELSKEKLELLTERLRNLGSINPLALSEYNKEKEEMDRLKFQRDDILKAKENLLATIKEIDHYAVRGYRKTFKGVREAFREVFSELFEGGEADLILKERAPLWTSEIEVMARPKGKNPKRLNQLSDGEKTLLAIALLFALYRIKPAPFCFLDEIDAALDDANVRRFSKFLKELSKKIQIIVITHNRETISQANTLYGVTMETPGVSKLVSVKLDELRKEGE